LAPNQKFMDEFTSAQLFLCFLCINQELQNRKKFYLVHKLVMEDIQYVIFSMQNHYKIFFSQ